MKNLCVALEDSRCCIASGYDYTYRQVTSSNELGKSHHKKLFGPVFVYNSYSVKYQVGQKALHQPLEQFGLRLTPHGKKRSSSFSSIVLTFPASGSIRSGLWWSAFFWTIISSLIDAGTFRVRCWLNHWPPFPPEQNSACSYYTILTLSSNPILNGLSISFEALDCNSQVGWVG